MDKPPVRQARPMMARPQVPTRLVVSGGPGVKPFIAMASKPSLLDKIKQALGR